MDTKDSKVLIIEDAAPFQLLIEAALKPLGVSMSIADSGKRTRELLAEHQYSLIVLDVGLPDVDGFELCTQIQSMSKFADTPIVFLTGRNEVQDKVAAFSMGAEDYVVKPFDPVELRARIEAKLKRKLKSDQALAKEARTETHFILGSLEVQLTHQRAYVHEKQGTKRELSLTPLDFKLLYHFARNPDRPFTREELLAEVWGTSVHVYGRTVDAHIYSLRKQLGDVAHYIESVLNVGYKLHVPKSNR